VDNTLTVYERKDRPSSGRYRTYTIDKQNHHSMLYTHCSLLLKVLSEKCAQTFMTSKMFVTPHNENPPSPPFPVEKPARRFKIGKSNPYPSLTALERPPKTKKISLTP